MTRLMVVFIDQLIGGLGADILSGGDGNDEVNYEASNAGVNVNLTTNIASGGDAAGDTFASVENIVGSRMNDTLQGNDAVNELSGGEGNDTLIGGAGADILSGGDGTDTVDYSTSSAVNINLASGVAQSGGDAAGDRLLKH